MQSPPFGLTFFFVLQIILTYNTTINESQVVWTEPGLGNNTQSSYLMCQMKWHTVRVAKQGLNITITLDELRSVSSSVKYGANMTGELFLGGYPGKLCRWGLGSISSCFVNPCSLPFIASRRTIGLKNRWKSSLMGVRNTEIFRSTIYE